MVLVCSLRKFINRRLYDVVSFDNENKPDAAMMLEISETSYHENYTGTRQFIHIQNAF